MVEPIGRKLQKPQLGLFPLLAVIGVAAVMAGCAKREMYTTNVISIPPGARIEIDDDYLGDAPLDVKWEGWVPERLFTRNHRITATSTERRSQTKWFNGEKDRYLSHWADPIPKTILFDFGSSIEKPPLKTYATEVVSQPPGARIEVNDEYKGDAPLVLEWSSQAGYFAGKVVIRALPIHPGQQVHEKTFDPFSPIPNIVFFDMRLVAPPRNYKLNISAEDKDRDPNKDDGDIVSIEHNEMIWVKCDSADCEAAYQIDRKDFYEQIDEKADANSASSETPPLVCKECGKQSLYRAVRCEKCGLMFFYGNVSDFDDRCPECGYSRIEEDRKQAHKKK